MSEVLERRGLKGTSLKNQSVLAEAKTDCSG